MAKLDQKKIEHVSERHEIAQDIVAIKNLKRVKQEKKDELIKDLLDEKYTTQSSIECPYPKNEQYLELWKKLTPREQAYMKANIRVSGDGKIEMIKMHKKFSLLAAESNEEKNIIKTSRYTYFTPKAAEHECNNNGKKLLENFEETREFISHFPGTSHQDKIRNFLRLFGLIKTGFYNSKENMKYYDTSYAILSKPDKDGTSSGVLGDAIFSSGYCTHVGVDSDDLQPVVSYEDC